MEINSYLYKELDNILCSISFEHREKIKIELKDEAMIIYPFMFCLPNEIDVEALKKRYEGRIWSKVEFIPGDLEQYHNGIGIVYRGVPNYVKFYLK